MARRAILPVGRDERGDLMSINTIRERLSAYQPRSVEGPGHARAAVAIVLRDGVAGSEFIVIQRSQRDNDPWSGHMALPGGRQAPSDGDLFMTAARETHEEVGVDLLHCSELLGHLDDRRAGGGRLDLVITPFVCALTAPVTLTPNHQEVANALWVPLAALGRPEAQGSYHATPDGQTVTHEALVYQGHRIWGLTYRILRELLAALGHNP